ncbi:MAG TPA: hypothetical protein DDW52_21050 [Planctomycetaceae bacterium]|nr:hypothetical protein [Planctomycetaceae bacterium]
MEAVPKSPSYLHLAERQASSAIRNVLRACLVDATSARIQLVPRDPAGDRRPQERQSAKSLLH